MESEFDVVIIGAGGGGAVVAKELGEHGIKVLVLEAGPWYGNQKWPNPNTEPGAIGSTSYDDLSIELLKKSFTDLEDDMNNFAYGKFRWGPSNQLQSSWYRNFTPEGYSWQNSGVGGSTLHYFGNCPRAYPQAVEGIWPISYNELIPYYEKVEKTLPVHEAPATPKEDIFYYGAKKAGWEELKGPNVTSPGYRPQPNAILRASLLLDDNNKRSLDEPVGCTLRGHCINGCHVGRTVDGVAKRSTFVSYIPAALRTGNVEVRPNSFVIKVLTNENGRKGLYATGVRYRNTWSGEITEVKCEVVVMAGGGIETPRLWLNSDLPSNGWVGRGLINHWFDCVSGIFEEDKLIEAIGVPDIKPFVGQNGAARLDYPGLGAIQSFGVSPGIHAALVFGTSEKRIYQKNQPVTRKPWDVEGMVVGEQLKEFMRAYPRTLDILILTDDEVNQKNYVKLDPVRKDENGYVPMVRYYPSKKDEKKRNLLAHIAADLLKKAGAKTVIRSFWPANSFIHIASTMRMGYVTDTNCEAYQVKRLFIADNSVLFNGLGGPNPTLTTQALATRTSEMIRKQYFHEV